MSFNASIFGHVVQDVEKEAEAAAAEAKHIEEEIVADIQALINKFRPHVTSASFNGSHVTTDLAPQDPEASHTEE